MAEEQANYQPSQAPTESLVTSQAPTAETPPAQPSETKPAEPEAKPAEGEAKAEGPKPLAVEDLKLPEGMKADDPALADTLKDLAGLPAETVQKLVDRHAQLVKQVADSNSQAWQKLNEQWQSEARADKEIGGEKLDKEVVPLVQKAIDKANIPGLKEALALTGAGNNPAVIKFAYMMAKTFVENSQHVQGAPAAQPKSAAEIMYPNMAKG